MRAILFAVLVTVGCRMGSDLRELASLQFALAAEFSEPTISLNLTNRTELTVTLRNSPNADLPAGRRAAFARRVGRFVRGRYARADSLQSIVIAFESRRGGGPLTLTGTESSYRFMLAQLDLADSGDASPATQEEPADDASPPQDTVFLADSASLIMMLSPASSDAILVQPITIRRDGAFSQLPVSELGDSAGDAFRALWFRPGLAYHVFSRGAAIGSLWAFAPGEPACTGLDGRARWLARPADAPALALVSNAAGLAGSFGGPPISSADSARLLAAVRAAVPDTATLGDLVDGLALNAALSLRMSGQPTWLAATATASDTAERSITVLVIAAVGEGGLQTAYRSFHQGVEKLAIDQRLIDFADLTGDGRAELVMRRQYWESYDFVIFGLTGPRAWTQLYAGGGGGC